MPRRIQRKRTKGWRMPARTKYIGRGSQFGNPYRIEWHSGWWEVLGPDREIVASAATKTDARRMACNFYRQYVEFRPELVEAARRELRGYNLCCWCPLPKKGEPDVCHRAILLEVANEPESRRKQ